MASEKHVVEGFEFANDHEVNIAKSEVRSISYIVSRTDMNNPKSVLVVYNRVIEKKLFKTPIGIKFLKEIQEMLLANKDIEDSMVKPIPVVIQITHEKNDQPTATISQNSKSKIIEKTNINYKKHMINSIIANMIFIIVIIMILIITSNSKNLNIINYENRIKAQYSAWENELNQREEALNTTD